MQYQGVEVESLSCLKLMHCHNVTVKLKLLESFCTEQAKHNQQNDGFPSRTMTGMKLASKSVQEKLKLYQFVSLVLLSRLGGAGGGPLRSVA